MNNIFGGNSNNKLTNAYRRTAMKIGWAVKQFRKESRQDPPRSFDGDSAAEVFCVRQDWVANFVSGASVSDRGDDSFEFRRSKHFTQ